MLTVLFNHKIDFHRTTTTKDAVGSTTYAPTNLAYAIQQPGRVDSASAQMIFDYAQRNIQIDYIVFTEVSNVKIGDWLEYPANRFLRVKSVKPYYAQGNIVTYYEVGCLEVTSG